MMILEGWRDAIWPGRHTPCDTTAQAHPSPAGSPAWPSESG